MQAVPVAVGWPARPDQALEAIAAASVAGAGQPQPLLAALCASTALGVAQLQLSQQTGQAEFSRVLGWAIPLLVQIAGGAGSPSSVSSAADGPAVSTPAKTVVRQRALRGQLTALEALTDLAGAIGQQDGEGPPGGMEIFSALQAQPLADCLTSLTSPEAIEMNLVASAQAFADASVTAPEGENPAAAMMRMQAEEQGKANATVESQMAAAVPTHALRALANLLMFEVLQPNMEQASALWAPTASLLMRSSPAKSAAFGLQSSDVEAGLPDNTTNRQFELNLASGALSVLLSIAQPCRGTAGQLAALLAGAGDTGAAGLLPFVTPLAAVSIPSSVSVTPLVAEVKSTSIAL
eukprot:SAG31_NODE_5076_length_2760_cov_1.299511_2_plen_351_part_00